MLLHPEGDVVGNSHYERVGIVRSRVVVRFRGLFHELSYCVTQVPWGTRRVAHGIYFERFANLGGGCLCEDDSRVGHHGKHVELNKTKIPNFIRIVKCFSLSSINLISVYQCTHIYESIV